MNDPRLPAIQPGRHPKPIVFTPSEIKHAADRLLSTDCSNARSLVLEILYDFVVLSDRSLFNLVSKQVAISANMTSFSRLLRRYRNDGLVSHVPPMTLKKVRRAGLQTDSPWSAYRLGPVGEEYIKRKGWNGSNPLHSSADESLVHDLICAETMLKMRQLWLEFPEDKRGLVEVRGPGSLAVWDAEKKAYQIAPDGLLVKHSLDGAFERAFLVEYQNVRALLQVQNKIKKYDEIARLEYRWMWDFWGLDEMPWVLIIYRQGSTLQHYQEEIAQRDKMAARFAAIALEDVWAGKLSIKPIRKQA